jgi:hypothetical protein
MQFAQNLQTDTEALAMPDGRRVGQPGHEVAKQFLLERMAEIELEPFAGDSFELPFQRGGIEFGNLVGVIRGSDPDAKPILVGAHYDSVIDAPCADDNATAVAVTLAIAEHFKTVESKRDLIIAIFDSEEPPYFHSEAMGSTRFYEDHCDGIEFACAIIMDLIGHDVEIQHPAAGMMPTLRRLVFVLGSESDAALPEVVEWAAGEAKGLKVFPSLNRYVGDMSDHYAFRLGGQPFLFLSCGQGKHYHLPSDTLDWINFDKVRHVFALVADLVSRIDQTVIAGEGCDPSEFEIRMIKKLVGMPYPMLLKMAGLKPLKTREDLDAFAALLTDGLVG